MNNTSYEAGMTQPYSTPKVDHFGSFTSCASAAAVGEELFLFGGHVLSQDEHGKKCRHFFNDLWKLSTVRVHAIGHLLHQ